MISGSNKNASAAWEKIAQARREFLTSHEREEAIPVVLKELHESLGLSDLAIYVPDMKQQTFTKACQGNKPLGSSSLPFSVHGDSLVGRAARTMKSLGESCANPLLPRRDTGLTRSGTRLAVPIQIPEKNIGVLAAHFPEDPVESWKVQALESLAVDLGIFTENLRSTRLLRRRVGVDEETGLQTNDHFLELLEIELERARRDGSPLSLMALNCSLETHRSQWSLEKVQPPLLRELGQLLRGACRTTDLLGKSDGNGILIGLTGVDPERSIRVAERLTQLILNIPFYPSASCSLGIVSYPFHGHTKEELLFMAHQACRKAGDDGGKRYCAIPSDPLKSAPMIGIAKLLTQDFQTGPQAASQMATHLEAMSTDREFSSFTRGIIEALAAVLDDKDHYDKNHADEAVGFAEALGRALNLPAEEFELALLAIRLHDLGKIGVPSQILSKPGPLNESEWWIVKEHPTLGAKILASVKSLAPLIPIVQCHHERWDGLGYPMGLKESEIPAGARFISLLDTFQAIISRRPYKQARSVENALGELKQFSGTHFDPHLVETFCSLFGQDTFLGAMMGKKQMAQREGEVTPELAEMLSR
ncbi:MAG: HD domain-containing phosphohydrolase [Terriglobia bacterium]